jgi:predicted site-specific integrase-resolvase
MPEAPDLITIAQAVSEFGLNRVTIHRWITAGRLTRYERPGGRPRVFVDRRELRKLLEPKPTRKRR